MAECKLPPEAIAEMEKILRRGNKVEVGLRKDKVIVWEVSSKTKYEVAAGGQ